MADRYLHKKRGSEYILLGIGKMQSEMWEERGEGTTDAPSPLVSVDMREVAIYRSIADGSLWVRPREEFEDGRFEPILGKEEGTLSEVIPQPGDLLERLTGHDRYSDNLVGQIYEVSLSSSYWRDGMHLVATSEQKGWTTMRDKGRFRVVSRAATTAKGTTNDQ